MVIVTVAMTTPQKGTVVANFNLADLVPEYDTFTDTDESQTKYQVRTIKMMSAVDLAELTVFQRDAARLQHFHVDESTEPEELKEKLKMVTEAVNGFLHLIMPSMPETRIVEIELNYKLGFMTWWQARQEEIQPSPPPNRKARRAAQSSRPKLSSRGSSRSTALTPSES